MHDRHSCLKSVISRKRSKCLDRVDPVHLVRNVRKHFPKENCNHIFKAVFADTKEDFNIHWGNVSQEVKDYILIKGGIELKEFVKVFAMEAGVTVNDDNTSNRVEQEMIRSKKQKIRHQFVLKAFIKFAQQVMSLIFHLKIMFILFNLFS